MTALVNVAILVVAAICVVAAVLSILIGLQLRNRLTNAPYGVARQEMRRSMQIALLRAAAFGILALIVFGVYGLSARPDDMLSLEPEPGTTVTATPAATDAPTTTPTPDETPTPDAVMPADDLPTLTATAPALPTSTAAPTETPTITPTPVPSALVASEVGLYLREAPGGTQELELLPVGTVLTLLDGRETVDGVEWQQVRAPSGLEGWVAVEFIEYQQ